METKVSYLIVLTLVFVVAFLGCGAGEQPERDEPSGEEEVIEPEGDIAETLDAGSGNTPGEAMPISAGENDGILEPGEEDDWYTFEAGSGEIISFSFAPGNDAEGINVEVLDPDMDCMWIEWNVPPPVTKSFSFITSSEIEDSFYIHMFQGEPGTYSFELTSEMQDDAGLGIDAGGRAPEAENVDPGNVVSGLIGDYDEEDWYSFEVKNGEILHIAFTPGNDAEGINIELLDPDHENLWIEWNVAPGVTKTRTVMMNCSSGGTYYAHVFLGETGEYSFEITCINQDDAGMVSDAGDRAVYAFDIPFGETVSGALGDYDEDDWFSFEIAEGESFELSFVPGHDTGSLNIEVCDPEQNSLWIEWDVQAGVTATFNLPEGAEAGVYYAHVFQGEAGDYMLEVH